MFRVLFFSFSVIFSCLFAASAQLHNTAGLAFYYQGKYAQSFEEFLKALKVDPNNVIAHYNLGRIFEKQGKGQEAFVQYQRTLSLDPSHDGARTGHKRLIRFKPQEEVRVKTREEMLAEKMKGEGAAALEAGEELLQRRLHQIDSAFSQKQYDQAREMIDLALQNFPKSAELYFYSGRYYFLQKNYVDSIRDINTALSMKLQNEDVAWYLLGLNHESLGDYLKAESSLSKALELSPSNSIYYDRLGEILSKQGKSRTAVEKFREGVKVNPGSVETRVKLNRLSRELSLQKFHDGKLKFEQREYQQAWQLFTDAIELGNLDEDMKIEARNLVQMCDYWVQKAKKVEKVQEVQREKTQQIRLERTVSFEQAVLSREVYLGEYVSWSGRVLSIKQKKDYYEILVDIDLDNDDFQEDVELSTWCVVRVRGKIPQDDKRLSYLGQAEFDGKFKSVEYIKNPFNGHESVKKMPVIWLTDGKFSNPAFGSGYLRIFPDVDYRE